MNSNGIFHNKASSAGVNGPVAETGIKASLDNLDSILIGLEKEVVALASRTAPFRILPPDQKDAPPLAPTTIKSDYETYIDAMSSRLSIALGNLINVTDTIR
jgi:hypothetical protein